MFIIMTLLYKKIQRVNPLQKEAPRKWYPVVKSLGTLSEKEVAKRISDEMTLNPKEAEVAGTNSGRTENIGGGAEEA